MNHSSSPHEDRAPGGPTPARAGRLDLLWAAWARRSIARPWRRVALGLLVLAACLPASVRLYAELHTDLRELLPQGAPAARGLTELEERLGGLAALAVVVRTEDFDAGARFVDALAPRLQALPKELVARVHFRVDAERDFFERHGALYADEADLESALRELRQRVRAEKTKANPLAVDLTDEDDAPAAAGPQAATQGDREALGAPLRKLKDALSRLDAFRGGYLSGEGGTTFVLQLSPSGAAVNLADNQRMVAAVRRAVDETNPRSFHPSLRVGYGGEVMSVIEAQEALVRDLLVSSALVLVLVGGALLLFYRRIRSIHLLVLPLFTGVALTFALSRAVIHYLNPNTAFLGSIIVGNGINAGIMLLARYFEERRHGKGLEGALTAALQTTWRGTLLASAGAAASYGSLVFVSFRGFNQFGFMGFFGMLLCWSATYATMPAFIALSERRWPFEASPSRGSRLGAANLAGMLGRSITARPLAWTGLTVALVAGSAVGVVRFARDPIEYDFTHLGSRSGLEQGAASWDRHVDAVMQSYQTPTVVLTDSPARAAAVAKALRASMAQAGSTLASVRSLDDLVPGEQGRKLATLRALLAELTPRVIDGLPADLQATVRTLKARTQLTPLTLADVPERLSFIFQEKDGRQGLLVLAYPTLAADSRNGRTQLAHALEVRAAVAEADPPARVAGQMVLTSDIVRTITEDGRFAATLSLAFVALLVVLAMRRVSHALWVVGSLSLGVLWMFGVLGLAGIKFNFVNFAVLPITFGIGVDYAVNLYQRYRETNDAGEAVAGAGGAVALCSATTIIGYAVLLIADSQAIASFGLTAVIGELTCLFAALVSLPALLALRDRRGMKGTS